VVVPIPASVAEHDILTIIEYWAFRLALLIVFLSWLARHVIHELKVLRAAINEWRPSATLHPAPEAQEVYPRLSP
jgi:hypothetical protein